MQTLIKISPQEYLEMEQQTSQKSEYHQGEIVAMAGASEKHNTIVTNLVVELGICAKYKNCKVYTSDLLVKLSKCDKYVYPDVILVCGEPSLEKHGGIDVLLNPLVIIEVLSESTQDYDKDEKMRCYFELDSLQQYILVDSKKMYVQNYNKTNAGDWLLKITQTLQEKVKIQDCDITLEDIYRKVKFEEK